jgi:hypothetical protein
VYTIGRASTCSSTTSPPDGSGGCIETAFADFSGAIEGDLLNGLVVFVGNDVFGDV